MIVLNVSGRRATVEHTESMPTGNVRSIPVLVNISPSDALWKNSLKVAVFGAQTNKGAWVVRPAVIDEDGLTAIPGDVLDGENSNVYVGIRGSFADNREVTTNMAFLGAAPLGAGGDLVKMWADEESAAGAFSEFLSNLMNLIDVPQVNDAVAKKHTHTNSALLDRFTGTASALQYGGKNVLLEEQDTFAALSLGTYDTLIFRSDPLSVPVYLFDEYDYFIELQNEDDSEYVRLTDTNDLASGLPVPFLTVVQDGVKYVRWFREYNGIYDVYSPDTWYIFDESTTPAEHYECDPPVLSGFTFAKLNVCGAEYTTLEDLPAKAQSALRSMSQLVNVDEASMGSIRIAEDALLRFNGVIQLNRVQTFSTIEDFILLLPYPPLPFDGKDDQFVLYLHLGYPVDVAFDPPETAFYGGDIPEFDESGTYKIIGSYNRTTDIWMIGVLKAEV